MTSVAEAQRQAICLCKRVPMGHLPCANDESVLEEKYPPYNGCESDRKNERAPQFKPSIDLFLSK